MRKLEDISRKRIEEQRETCEGPSNVPVYT